MAHNSSSKTYQITYLRTIHDPFSHFVIKAYCVFVCHIFGSNISDVRLKRRTNSSFLSLQIFQASVRKYIILLGT